MYESKVQSWLIEYYTFENKDPVFTIPLPINRKNKSPRVIDVTTLNEIVCFCLEGERTLWVYQTGKLVELTTHLVAITALKNHRGKILVYTLLHYLYPKYAKNVKLFEEYKKEAL